MGTPETVAPVVFQDVILDVSTALKEGEGIELSAEQVQALMEGFLNFTRIISAYEDEVEELKQKRRLWRPGSSE